MIFSLSPRPVPDKCPQNKSVPRPNCQTQPNIPKPQQNLETVSSAIVQKKRLIIIFNPPNRSTEVSKVITCLHIMCHFTSQSSVIQTPQNTWNICPVFNLSNLDIWHSYNILFFMRMIIGGWLECVRLFEPLGTLSGFIWVLSKRTLPLGSFDLHNSVCGISMDGWIIIFSYHLLATPVLTESCYFLIRSLLAPEGIFIHHGPIMYLG